MSQAAAEPKWIEWTGGDCPLPPEVVVDYLLDGETDERHEVDLRAAGDLRWTNTGNGADIIAYKVMSSPVSASSEIQPNSMPEPGHCACKFSSGGVLSRQYEFHTRLIETSCMVVRAELDLVKAQRDRYRDNLAAATDEIERLVAFGPTADVLAEREACAKVLDDGYHLHAGAPTKLWADQVAALIRARSQEGKS